MKKIFLILMSVFLLATCQKAPEVTVTGAPDGELDNAAHTFTVTVKSNRPWSASAQQAWVHVSPGSSSSATEAAQVTITVDENRSNDDRSTAVVFTAEDAVTQVMVSQKGRPGMMLPQTSKEFSVEAKGNDITVVVWSNIDYDIAINAEGDWIKLVSTKAMPEHQHTFQIAENGSRHVRKGTIEFNYTKDNLHSTVNVSQDFYPILVDRDTLRASGRGWKAAFETVGANPDDYKISLEDRWLSFDKSEKTSDGTSRFYVDVAPLPEGGEPRESHILVYYKGLAEPDTLLVHQYALVPALSYSTTEMKVGLPEVTGRKANGFVFWGDGTNDYWRQDLQHSYSEEGPHTITMELNAAEKINITAVEHGMTINLKDMRK